MYLVGDSMNSDFEKIDSFAREVMGFEDDKILDYNKVVERYASILGVYANNLSTEDFINLDYYESLNFSFYHCTGYILDDYFNLSANSCKSKSIDNKHYNAILFNASEIVKRFNYLGMTDMALMMERLFHVIATAVYNFEKSLENPKIKILS